MRLRLKITGVFLIFALLTSCVAATENKDLPTKEEITDFIAGIPVSDNYIITVFNAVKDKQPAWNCDRWVDENGNQILSLYYVNPDSEKGYDSIYFNELGKEISKRGLKVELVESYVGEAVPEENTPVEPTTGSTLSSSSLDLDTSNDSPERKPTIVTNNYINNNNNTNINNDITNINNINNTSSINNNNIVNSNSSTINSDNTEPSVSTENLEEKSLIEDIASGIRDIIVGVVSGKLIK